MVYGNSMADSASSIIRQAVKQGRWELYATDKGRQATLQTLGGAKVLSLHEPAFLELESIGTAVNDMLSLLQTEETIVMLLTRLAQSESMLGQAVEILSKVKPEAVEELTGE